MKNNLSVIQKFKTELLEHGQLLPAAKSKLKKAEDQLIAAKNYVQENASGLLSESDMKIYLEMDENLLFDGILECFETRIN